MASEPLEDGGEANRLDVRAVEGEPFDDIMAALGRLDEGETLLLINSFEPKPLYGVLESRGFEHESSEEDGVWHVEITHA